MMFNIYICTNCTYIYICTVILKTTPTCRAKKVLRCVFQELPPKKTRTSPSYPTFFTVQAAPVFASPALWSDAEPQGWHHSGDQQRHPHHAGPPSNPTSASALDVSTWLCWDPQWVPVPADIWPARAPALRPRRTVLSGPPGALPCWLHPEGWWYEVETVETTASSPTFSLLSAFTSTSKYCLLRSSLSICSGWELSCTRILLQAWTTWVDGKKMKLWDEMIEIHDWEKWSKLASSNRSTAWTAMAFANQKMYGIDGRDPFPRPWHCSTHQLPTASNGLVRKEACGNVAILCLSRSSTTPTHGQPKLTRHRECGSCYQGSILDADSMVCRIPLFQAAQDGHRGLHGGFLVAGLDISGNRTQKEVVCQHMEQENIFQ